MEMPEHTLGFPYWRYNGHYVLKVGTKWDFPIFHPLHTAMNPSNSVNSTARLLGDFATYADGTTPNQHRLLTSGCVATGRSTTGTLKNGREYRCEAERANRRQSKTTIKRGF